MKCPHCGTEFEVKRSAQIYCRPRCTQNAAKKRHHQKYGWGGRKRSISRKARDKKRSKEHIERNTLYVYNEKVVRGCSHCSERRPSTLDYHHVEPDKKEFEISNLMRRGLSFKKMKAEIAKCILLCANCHRVEERGTGFKDVEKEHHQQRQN
jgi:hypothetical protein